ncbi:hypothetical protein PBY51_017976 [Eleginops maclovinus]|uniref:Uncharacterized protein n=1 Tax=Eleginops maclovinus TaxID=56733 RepID=A0AAN7XKS9_ELEMC|nr:hypothetical protein PBY51_017976 [Eleginops maclovinus]
MTSPITSGLELLRHTILRNDSHAARISTAVSDAGAADVLWRTLDLGGAQCTKTPRNGIPGYPTPTHHSLRNSPPPSVLLPSSFTSAFPHYHPHSSASPSSRPNSGAPPIGRKDFPFSAKMEEEVSRLIKGAHIV